MSASGKRDRIDTLDLRAQCVGQWTDIEVLFRFCHSAATSFTTGGSPIITGCSSLIVRRRSLRLSVSEIGARVDAAAVIPHHQIARTPDMFVQKFLLRLVFEQEFQQFAAFVFGQALYFLGH